MCRQSVTEPPLRWRQAGTGVEEFAGSGKVRQANALGTARLRGCAAFVRSRIEVFWAPRLRGYYRFQGSKILESVVQGWQGTCSNVLVRETAGP